MEGWEYAKIGEVFETVTGSTPKKSVQEFFGGPYPFVKPPQLCDDLISQTPESLSEAGAQEARILPPRSILVSCIGILGKTAIAEIPLACNQQINAIKPNTDIALPTYVHYFCQSPMFLNQLDRLASGTTVPIVNKSKFNRINIPLPPLPTQRRIVAILDEAFAAIDRAIGNVERNLGNVGELWESYLESVIHSRGDTWRVASVGELGVVQTGSTPRTNDKANFGNYIPFIKPADFAPDGTLDYSNSGLSEQGLKGSRLVKAGSVLMVCIGTIGKTGFTEVDVTTNQQINALTPSGTVLPKFVYFQMLSRRFQDAVVSQVGQTTLPIINKSKWSKLPIHFPESINEQQSIVTDLEFLAARRDQVRFIYESKLDYLHTLKQSLLHQAFTGRLTSEREVEEEMAGV